MQLNELMIERTFQGAGFDRKSVYGIILGLHHADDGTVKAHGSLLFIDGTTKMIDGHRYHVLALDFSPYEDGKSFADLVGTKPFLSAQQIEQLIDPQLAAKLKAMGWFVFWGTPGHFTLAIGSFVPPQGNVFEAFFGEGF